MNRKVVMVWIEYKGKVFIVTRAVSPGAGKRSLIAGEIEQGEKIQETAIREAEEEAKLKIKIDRKKKNTFFKNVELEGEFYDVWLVFARAKRRRFELKKDEAKSAEWVEKEKIKNLDNFGPLTETILIESGWLPKKI